MVGENRLENGLLPKRESFAEVGALVASGTTTFTSGNSSDGREGTLALPVTKVTDFTIALKLASATTAATSFGNIVREIPVEATAVSSTTRQVWKRAFARPIAKVPRRSGILGYYQLVTGKRVVRRL